MNSSLSAMRPALVGEWSEKNLPLTPDKITYGSNKSVWWKGACGHEWQASVKTRSSGENSRYEYGVATRMAMTVGMIMILLYGAGGEPGRGEIPMRQASYLPLSDFP